MKNELKPLFNMTYSALMQLGDKAVSLIERDAAELAKYGVNDAVKSNIKQKTEALKEMASDEELLYRISADTVKKDDSAEKVRDAVRSIAVRAKNLFGEKSPQYKQLGIKDLTRMKDNELYRCAKRVIRTAEEYLSELSQKGLTQEEIDALRQLALQLDDNIDHKDDAVRKRDIAAEERVKLGNKLYVLISEVFDYGKDYWKHREESKYNDYIIYEHAGANMQSYLSIAPGDKILALEGIAVDDNSILTIENKGKTPLKFYTADALESDTPANALILEAKAAKTLSAQSISNGTQGYVIAENTSAGEGRFLVKVEG